MKVILVVSWEQTEKWHVEKEVEWPFPFLPSLGETVHLEDVAVLKVTERTPFLSVGDRECVACTIELTFDIVRDIWVLVTLVDMFGWTVFGDANQYASDKVAHKRKHPELFGPQDG